ncbi:MAG: HAMP domain-containing histidine kinase [Verrucomicrobia bacterium]|nr:HAMP domain-containing histidine kinase [Verrucomicrobiota bacterium]
MPAPPLSPSPAVAVLEALGYGLFVRDAADGQLRTISQPPAWLAQLWPALDAPGSVLPVADASPFLENFLLDAAACWAAAGEQRLSSGPWVERDPQGGESELEATALTLPNAGGAVLLIQRLGEEFTDRKSVLQKSRENVLINQRLNTELQKKDILLHCIAEDMSAALGNVITSLRLIELEQEPAKIRRLLDLAALATQEQQSLVAHVLDAFADEIRCLYGGSASDSRRSACDVATVAQETVAALEARFREKRVRFNFPTPTPASARVAINREHLERILTNLLENALDAARVGGGVALRWKVETDTVLVEIEDSGRVLPPETSERLFSRFALASSGAANAETRLHFCRIAVENCHGEIGYEPRADEAGGVYTGNIFWFRLPKSPALVSR